MGMAKDAGSAHNKINGLKKSLGGVWRITGGILLFNIIRHITHSIRDLIGTVMDFETAMYNVNSVAQLSTEELAKLQNQVLDLALDPRIKDGPAALAKGLYIITSSGYSAQDALVLLETAAIAATAGMTTTEVAAGVLTATLGSYGLGVSHAADMSDKLFQIVNISRYTFEDLAGSLDSVLPTAAALGIGIEEVGAAMAVMASKGVDAQTATVQLNGILSALLKPSEAMKEVLTSLHYENGQAMLDALGFVGTMKKLTEVVGDDQDIAAALFGDVRALRGEMNLTNDDGVLLTAMLEKMGLATEGTGATSKALAEQMKASSFQIAVLRKNIQVLAILGFGMLAPYLNKALVGINKFVSGAIKGFRHFREKGYGIFHAFRASLKNTVRDMFGTDATIAVLKFYDFFVKTFFLIKGVILSLWGPFKAVFGFIVDHFNIIGPAILGAVVALKIFGAVLAIVGIIASITFSPLIIAMIAVAAIGALVAVAWYNNWFDIQGKTKAAIQFISKWLGKLWEFIQPVIDVIKLLGSYFKDVMTNDIQPGNLAKLPGWIRPIALVIGRVVKSVRVFIVTWQKLGALAAFKTIPTQIRAFGRAMAKLLDSIGLKNFAKAYQATFNQLSKIVSDVISLVDNLVHGRWKKAWQDFKQLGIDMVKLYFAWFKGQIALVKDIFNLIPWGTIGSALLNGLLLALGFLVTTGIPAMLQLGVDLISTLLSGMSTFWTETLIPWVTGLVSEVLGYFINEDMLNLFYNAGNAIIGYLAEGVTFGWNWLMGWFGDLPGQITGVFDGIFWPFYNIGIAIIEGMAQGISSVWNKLTGWISSIIEELERIPDWLIPNSPSKTMTKYGKSAVEGLAVGIQKTIPMLKNAVGNVMSTMGQPATMGGSIPRSSGLVPAAAGGIMSSSAVGSGGPVSITNHINGVGDPEAVANLVVRKTIRAIRRRSAGLR